IGLGLAPPAARAEVRLRAQVRTSEIGGRVWLRSAPEAGRAGREIELLPNGAKIELDVSALLKWISANASPAARAKFFSQSRCDALQSAWKELLSPAALSGQTYHYVPVRANGQSGFVSVEYLAATQLSCEDLHRAVLAEVIAPPGACA